MQNLIYLILIVLSAGAGWFGGSWSGRDAKQALEAARKSGQAAETQRAAMQSELDNKLKAIKADHDAEIAKYDARFDAATTDWNRKLADRDNKILALNTSAKSFRQRADELTRQLGSAKTPEEVARLKAEIAALQGKAQAAEVESLGNVCSKTPVPADLLAGLRVEAL